MWACGRSVCHHHLRLARIGHVDGGEILRRALVREPEDAAPSGRDLDRHAFAHAAEAVEQVVAEQLEVPGDRPPLLCGDVVLDAVGFGAAFLGAAFLGAGFWRLPSSALLSSQPSWRLPSWQPSSRPFFLAAFISFTLHA